MALAASQPISSLPSLHRSCTLPSHVSSLAKAVHSGVKPAGAARPSCHSPSLRPTTSWALKPRVRSKVGLTVSTRPKLSVMAIKSLLCENTLAARRLASRWRSSCASTRRTRQVKEPVTSNKPSTDKTAITANRSVCCRQGRSTSWVWACASTSQG